MMLSSLSHHIFNGAQWDEIADPDQRGIKQIRWALEWFQRKPSVGFKTKTRLTPTKIVFTDAGPNAAGIVIFDNGRWYAESIQIDPSVSQAVKESIALRLGAEVAYRIGLRDGTIFVVDATAVAYAAAKGYSISLGVNKSISAFRKLFPTSPVLNIRTHEMPADELSRGSSLNEKKALAAASKIALEVEKIVNPPNS
jgi:hypothetical protein